MLKNYTHDLFATRETLDDALAQANDVYGKAMNEQDVVAMITAVHIVLNTAIQEHERELAVICDKHNAEMQALQSKLEKQLGAHDA